MCSNRILVTRYIIGYKKEESDALLKFLCDHISFGADFQARVKWAENTVVVWDVGSLRICKNPLTCIESRDGPFCDFGLDNRPTPTSRSHYTSGRGAI